MVDIYFGEHIEVLFSSEWALIAVDPCYSYSGICPRFNDSSIKASYIEFVFSCLSNLLLWNFDACVDQNKHSAFSDFCTPVFDAPLVGKGFLLIKSRRRRMEKMIFET